MSLPRAERARGPLGVWCGVLGVLLAPRAVLAEEPAGYEAPPAGLSHEAITSGRRGAAIVVVVGVQNELAFDTLVLAYRPEGEGDFRGREMKLVSEGTYRGEIPPEGTAGHLVAYYIEARDKDGAPVAGRASAQAPLVIQLAGDPPWSQHDRDDEDTEDTLVGRRLFVGLLAGTGAGWARGNGDTNADTMIEPSVAFASLGQLVPEVGYWLGPSLMLSLQGRLQAVTGTTDVYAGGRIYHAANYAAAGFVKATWLARPKAQVHPFFSLAAGFGQIRHVVTFEGLKCGPSGRQVCVDTIATGPVAAGPGVGLFFDLGEHLLAVLEIDSQLTFPAYSVNVDANLGLAIRF